MKILVTGGAGYIGSHMVLALLGKGFEVIVLDNFSNSSSKNLETIKRLTKKDFGVINHDLQNSLSELKLENIDCVIHFAALKAVGESVLDPLKYYKNNIYGTLNLLDWIKECGIKKFIFSSTAAVYGQPDTKTVSELSSVKPESPYGKSKLMVEEILKDLYVSDKINSVILRYFNVAGNIQSGEIGDLQKNPQNLIPFMIMSHLGLIQNSLKVFGTDYPTRDGTGIRDYIHVLDLVDAHLKALNFLENNSGNFTFNLGTGNGVSVMEIIKAFEKILGKPLSYEKAPRRPGDIAQITTDAKKARDVLNWQAERNLEEMLTSSYRWYKDFYTGS